MVDSLVEKALMASVIIVTGPEHLSEAGSMTTQPEEDTMVAVMVG